MTWFLKLRLWQRLLILLPVDALCWYTSFGLRDYAMLHSLSDVQILLLLSTSFFATLILATIFVMLVTEL